MTDQDLNSKLDRLLALMEAQLELSRQSHREERLRRAHLSGEETVEPSHSEDQDRAGGGDDSMLGDPNTPTPAPRPRHSVSFNLNEHAEANYEKYASPTGPKYLKTRVDPYNRNRMDPYTMDQEEEASIMTERSKPVATPFPKFNPRDIEIYILEAEAWFRFNQVYKHTRMINHLGSQLEGTAREWMEAYNKLLALRLTSDAPGAATRHVEQFRDLEGQVNLGDNELTIDLFRGSLTRSIQEKFERNPPKELSGRWLGTINIDMKGMVTPRSGVSVDGDGDEVDDVGDEWTTAFGSIYIRTANLLWAPSDVSGVDFFDTAPPPQDLLAGLLCTAPPPSTGDGSFGSYLSSP
ncbi:uncharacterized protein UDID_17406 [Ustilago sp. UG-2017a]|nr:uncharacterized protein UDID_17406 [Ustilago sp. UG-2017a]